MTKVLLQTLMVLWCLSAFAIAQSNAKTEVSQQKERVVIKFARQHHAELATLLQQLKEMNEDKYRSAILELSRTYDRLERTKQRSEERYETELDLWKIDSRVKLLVARSIGGMEDETRAEIKKLLLRRNQIRHDQLVKERDRIKIRLSRVETQIEELKSRSDSVAEQDIERLLKSVSRLSNPKQNSNRLRSTKSTTTSVKKQKTDKTSLNKESNTKN